MKILHVMNDSIPLIGGYTTRSRCIVTHQRRIGIEPYVVTSIRQGPTTTHAEEFDGITYFRTRWPKRNFFKKAQLFGLAQEIYLFYTRIREIVTEISPDIIHAHSPILCAIPALLAARKAGIPIVYEIRAFWEDAAVASKKFTESTARYRFIRMLETIVCRRVDRIVPISRSMKEDLLTRGIPENRLFVIPNGVDRVSLAPKAKNKDLATRMGLDGKTVLGYLGTFYDFEGIDDLIRAFDMLHKQQNNMALLLIGGGEMEQTIRAQIKRLGNPNLILLGKVSHETTADYYALMDIVVYPRKSTRITEMTTPLKPLEAMALGKPVICSAVGGLKELVGDGNALFFTAGDEAELLSCCWQLIRNPSLAKQLGKAGKRRALEERNWFNLIDKYYNVYDCLQEISGRG